ESYGERGAAFQQRRGTVALSIADWASGTVRWTAGVTREHWPAGRATGASAGLRYQAADDRLAADARVVLWRAAGAQWQTSTALEWRSRPRNEGNVLLARGAASLASEGTPLIMWNGAGSGQGREELLRAHPLLHDGVIREAVFGRGLIGGNAEWRRWSAP